MPCPQPNRPSNRRDSTSPQREDGFTLLEILIVVTIIGLLMAFVASNLFSRVDDTRAKLAKGQVEKIERTLEIYKLDNGRYPTTEQGLDALVREPRSEPAPRRYQAGGYMKRDDILDPWGGELQYELPGRVNTFGFDICSYGPDGVESGNGPESDDICNYEKDAR